MFGVDAHKYNLWKPILEILKSFYILKIYCDHRLGTKQIVQGAVRCMRVIRVGRNDLDGIFRVIISYETINSLVL